VVEGFSQSVSMARTLPLRAILTQESVMPFAVENINIPSPARVNRELVSPKTRTAFPIERRLM
jgi:hypothetical protein